MKRVLKSAYWVVLELFGDPVTKAAKAAKDAAARAPAPTTEDDEQTGPTPEPPTSSGSVQRQ